jgi:hypothetical protein
MNIEIDYYRKKTLNLYLRKTQEFRIIPVSAASTAMTGRWKTGDLNS